MHEGERRTKGEKMREKESERKRKRESQKEREGGEGRMENVKERDERMRG